VSRSWKPLWREACGSTPPAYRVLVPDSVPDSVITTWLARGYRISPSDPAPAFVFPGMSRNLIKSNFLYRATAGAGLTATGIAALPTAMATLATGDLATGGLVTTGVFGVLTAIGAGWTGLKFRRDPRRLSNRDKEAAARARWITPAELGWIPGFQKGQDTDEQRLFHLAVVTARRIRQTRAWTHPILQDHVSRVDLDHAVASIGVRLRELVELRNELESIREPHTAARVDTYLTKLAKAFQSMAARVVAMHEYYEHLLDLDRQLLVLHNTERSRELGDRVLDVLSRTADDESADWQFRELNIEAESHAEVIRNLLTELEETAEEFDDLDDLDRRLAAAQRTHGGTDRVAGTAPGESGRAEAPAPGSSAEPGRGEAAPARNWHPEQEQTPLRQGQYVPSDDSTTARDLPKSITAGTDPAFDLGAELRRQAQELRNRFPRNR
jgi:hypothetical protein